MRGGNLTGKNRKKWLAKSEWAAYPVIIVLSILIIFLNFQVPKTDYYRVFNNIDDYCMTLSDDEYKLVTTTIQGLITGEDPDTTKISAMLSLSATQSALVKENQHAAIYVKFCEYHTEILFSRLNKALYCAIDNKNIKARYYLWQANICWNNPSSCD